MKRNYILLLVIFFLCSTFELLAQGKKKNPFRWGLQSGVNLSVFTVENSSVDKEAFLGLSFGIIGQKHLKNVKWRWGGFTTRTTIAFETGIIGTRNGYQYNFKNQAIYHEQFGVEVPIMLIFKNTDRRHYRRLRKSKINVIAKMGISLTMRPRKEIKNEVFDELGNIALLEETIQHSKIRIQFYSGFGLEKNHKNGSLTYTGFSFHISPMTTTEGTIQIYNNGQSQMGYLTKNDSYFSIDVKYFPPQKTKRQKGKGQLPDIIYNPRFL